MRRHAPFTTALVTLLVLTSYVGAAFVDCERPAHEAIREAARLSAAAPPVAHGNSRPEAHGAHGMSPSPVRGPHTMSSQEVMPGSEAPPHTAPAHDAHAGTSPSPAAQGPTPPCHLQVVLVPTCLCGCSETRALVGGSLARLGATIPAVYVAALPAAVVIDGHPPVELAESAPVVVDDPVPI